ncbi:MAG TPA: PAS domain-containing protein [Thalassobaculum sp.]
MDRPSFRQRIADPRLRSLYDYWLARRGDRPLLPRADFDPADLLRLLKFLILADVGDAGRAIRYRVVGTEIVAAYGVDYTGWTIQQLTSGPTLDYTYTLYGAVVGGRLPVYSEGRFRWFEREYRLTRRLHLPLSRGGAEVDMVLAAQVFDVEQPGRDELLVPARPDEVAADLAAATTDRR